MKIENFFSETGLLEEHLDLFEFRESQLEMSNLIHTAINNKEHVIIEAGTGTGKSFAYLIPLILYSIEKKEPVVISTNTKSLQQQMIKKDLPFLQNIFNQNNQDFTFKIFYGANNYLCINKTEKLLFASDNLFLKQNVKEYLKEYINSTDQSGIRYDMEINFNETLWYNINRDSDCAFARIAGFIRIAFIIKTLKNFILPTLL